MEYYLIPTLKLVEIIHYLEVDESMSDIVQKLKTELEDRFKYIKPSRNGIKRDNSISYHKSGILKTDFMYGNNISLLLSPFDCIVEDSRFKDELNKLKENKSNPKPKRKISETKKAFKHMYFYKPILFREILMLEVGMNFFTKYYPEKKILSLKRVLENIIDQKLDKEITCNLLNSLIWKSKIKGISDYCRNHFYHNDDDTFKNNLDRLLIDRFSNYLLGESSYSVKDLLKSKRTDTYRYSNWNSISLKLQQLVNTTGKKYCMEYYYPSKILINMLKIDSEDVKIRRRHYDNDDLNKHSSIRRVIDFDNYEELVQGIKNEFVNTKNYNVLLAMYKMGFDIPKPIKPKVKKLEVAKNEVPKN